MQLFASLVLPPWYCSYGLFGQAAMEADVLRNFTVAALEPLVWTRLAQAGEPRECLFSTGQRCTCEWGQHWAALGSGMLQSA